MKFVKGISLFFLYPFMMFLLGFFLGGRFQSFFYPGSQNNIEQNVPLVLEEKQQNSAVEDDRENAETADNEEQTVQKFRTTAATEEQKTDADTKFVIEETDLDRGTSMEMTGKLPEKYIGMNREQFLKAMEEYQLSPPLIELERGFVSLEVKSFSKERVCVKMNYSYTAPTTSFYLMAEDHYIVVYCDDKRTVYMQTNILLENLPDNLQQKIIAGMYIEDEKTLYHFLESYTS